MPYVKEKNRKSVELIGPEDAGELNYAITILIKQYVIKKGASYSTFNDVAGAIHNAYAEFYRRVVAPYEDVKIKENGDVW